MKKLISICLAAVTVMCSAAFAFAAEVPVEETVQNLNGVQQYIRVYCVDANTAPESLVSEDFTYDGYTYSFSSMTKSESWYEDEKTHTETYTAETAKKDLSAVLEALPVSIEYDADGYKGTLYLDHSTIETAAAGYKTSSYGISETRVYTDLDSNDMSYIPMTVTKDGKTLNLSGISWDVQATALVDDLLVPSLYKATAYYSGSATCRTATGYITNAEYTGTVKCRELESITYRLVYTGTEVKTDSVFERYGAYVAVLLLGGLAALAVIMVCASAKAAGNADKASEKYGEESKAEKADPEAEPEKVSAEPEPTDAKEENKCEEPKYF